MKRKTSFHSLPLVMVAMMMAACSSEDAAVPTGGNTDSQPRTWQVSIEAGPASMRAISVGGNDGTTLYTNWDPNDAVEVVKNGASVGTLTADVSEGNTAYATLTGTLTGTFNVGDAVTLCYHTAALDYTGQVGTIADVSTNKSYLTATSTVKSVDGDNKFLAMSPAAFSPIQSYLELSITYGNYPINIQSIDIWTGGGKLVKTKALDGTTTYFTSSAPLTITPATPTDKLFIALRDEYGAANNLHFEVTDVNGELYFYEGSKNLQYGKYYAGPVAMTDDYEMLYSANSSDIGKVVCAAGHLHKKKMAAPPGHTAVGILGKVTSTGHGLILALQDAASQTWNTINGWTSTTSYANGIELKVLPNDAARGSLPSYTKLGGINVSNWCVASKDDYSAIFENLGSTRGGYYGKTCDDNVNAYITSAGGVAISNNYYWCTTEYTISGNGEYAWRFENQWGGYQRRILIKSAPCSVSDRRNHHTGA